MARQLVIPFPETDGIPWGLEATKRLWLTVSFDLDSVEERMTHVFIGREYRKHFLWKEPLPSAEANVLASLPIGLADRISELRSSRVA